MIPKSKVLLVDDRIGDITWLLDLLRGGGYDVDHVSNEQDAIQKLDRLEAGKIPYALAIFDIMVSERDIMSLVGTGREYYKKFYRRSLKTGVRLCQHVRRELKFGEEELPIVCISARSEDREIQKELDQLRIPLFDRASASDENSLRANLPRYLPGVDV